jgi:hypothetical protein
MRRQSTGRMAPADEHGAQSLLRPQDERDGSHAPLAAEENDAWNRAQIG